MQQSTCSIILLLYYLNFQSFKHTITHVIEQGVQSRYEYLLESTN
jgi:hypothetical protein